MELTEEDFRSYKEYHEYFMMNHNGTSLLESAIAITPPPAAMLLWSVVVPALIKKPEDENAMIVFILEFALLVLPLVLCYTVLSSYIYAVSLSLLFIFAVILACQRRELPDYNKLVSLKQWLSFPTTLSHRPFITSFRAYVNVISCICILAVDFRVFPRRFSKTEVSGYGLMDTGAGLFVVANAMVSCKTLSLKLAIKSSAPLLVLGFMRLLAIWLVSYQDHVSEYGTHWNFFFTLAATRLLSVLMLSVVGNNFRSVVLIFVSLAIMHEFSLSVLGLKEWAVSSTVTRTNFITSNREGLISLVGYVCLHFGATVIFGRMRSQPRLKVTHWISFWKEIFTSSVVMWGVTHVLHQNFGVSRRVADLGYICWVLAYSLSLLTFFLMVELAFSALYYKKIAEQENIMDKMMKDPEEGKEAYSVPVMLKAVNYNGLIYFLLGNLLTGFINMSLKPLTVEKWPSTFVINIYMLTICLIIHVLYVNKIKLKVW